MEARIDKHMRQKHGTMSSFLDLPVELRLQCYKIFFHGVQLEFAETETNKENGPTECSNSRQGKMFRLYHNERLEENFMAILHLNHQIRKEALPVLSKQLLLCCTFHDRPQFPKMFQLFVPQLRTFVMTPIHGKGLNIKFFLRMVKLETLILDLSRWISLELIIEATKDDPDGPVNRKMFRALTNQHRYHLVRAYVNLRVLKQIPNLRLLCSFKPLSDTQNPDIFLDLFADRKVEYHFDKTSLCNTVSDQRTAAEELDEHSAIEDIYCP